MRIIIILFTVLAYSISGFAQNSDYLIVHLNDIGHKSTNNALQKFKATYTTFSTNPELKKHNLMVVKIPNNRTKPDFIVTLKKEYFVKKVEEDWMQYGAGKMDFTPNDVKFNRQWALNNNGSFSLPDTDINVKAGADMQMVKAWDIEKGNSNIIVAIIDTGCQINHPELAGRIWTNQNEIADNGIDDDQNGYIDDITGWDFINDDNNPDDDHGHGTNVCGIIATNGDNALGYSGVNMNCKIMTLKGLDENNSGLSSNIIKAIYYAVDNGANIINLSLGGGGSTAYESAVMYALDNNVTIVASMMNNNDDIIKYPAGYESVIGVGSTDPDDTRSAPFFWSETSGSSYGQHISVVAPGNYIFSIGHTLPDSYNRYWGGTSQAAPHVAGIASLLLSKDPALTPQKIKSIIETTADDQVGDSSEDTPGFDIYYGHGRVNAYSALSSTLSTTELKYLNKPTIDYYPNPTSNYLNIDTGARIKLPSILAVYNSFGQLVSQHRLTELNTKIEFNLASGVYILSINNETFKFVVK